MSRWTNVMAVPQDFGAEHGGGLALAQVQEGLGRWPQAAARRQAHLQEGLGWSGANTDSLSWKLRW